MISLCQIKSILNQYKINGMESKPQKHHHDYRDFIIKSHGLDMETLIVIKLS